MAVSQRQGIPETGAEKHGLARSWQYARYASFRLAHAFGALAAGLATVGWFVRGPFPAEVTIASAVLGALLCWGAAVDIRTFIIPDRVSLGLVLLGLAATWLVNPADLTTHVLAAAIAGALLWGVAASYRRYRGVDGLGFGDVKLFAAAGAWIGPEGLPGVLLIASLTAIFAMLVRQMMRGRSVMKRRIAFAPFLALGIWIVWIFGPVAWVG